MKDFLIYLISQIIDQPDILKVEEIPLDENSYQYNISCSQEDMGKIIGKEGKIIQAVRSVAKILAVKKNLRVRIQLL